MNHEQAMYRSHAEFYDLIYARKPYEDEANRVRALLADEGVGDGERVLEVACGTGRYLEHLRRWFTVSGVDLNPAMLDIARARVPDVELFEGDMSEFVAGVTVDAVLCLFSSLGYLLSDAHVADAADCFYKSVRPGGVIVIEPWIGPERFECGHVHMDTYSDESISLCRMSVSQREGDRSIIDFHWVAGRRGASGVEHFVDHHELLLRPIDHLVAVFERRGFECRVETDGLMPGRGLIVGIRGDRS